MEPKQNLRAGLRQSFRLNGLFAMPVLSGALGICVPVVACVTLRAGVLLSLLFALMLVPVCVISSLCFAYLPHYLRVIAVVLTASIVFAGAQALMQIFFGRAPSLYRVYAPLLIVSGLLIDRAERIAPRQTAWVAAADAAACAIGFALTACITGAVRELLSEGTLYGRVVLPALVPNRVASMPLFGFLVLGFLAAAVKAARLRGEARQKKRSGQR